MKILGMMSGTSGDGIDGALVDCCEDGSYKLIWHKSFDFTSEQFLRIQELMKPCSSIDVTIGNAYIAELYAKAFNSFFAKNDELPDYISAHGQTIWHQPKEILWDRISLRGTLQLLDASLLAQRTGIPVISNFRTADMAVGGQGAPLVPFADLKIFGNLFSEDFIVLNVGGIANITAIHKGRSGAEILCAFDTGPGNVLIDSYIQSENLGSFDEDGLLAANGKSIDHILEKVMDDPYFKLPYPKSTGREYFNSSILSLFDKDFRPEDVASTLLDVSVFSIAKAIKLLESDIDFPCRLIVAGGGGKNKELVSRLKKALDGWCKLDLSDEFGIPLMAREAMSFAILGMAFIRREKANVPEATGALKKVILGQLSPI